MGAGKYDGAKKRIENVEEKLQSSEQREAEFKPKGLMQELKDSGEKYTEKNVIFVVKQQNGKIAWLEEGNEGAGLKHIKIKHSGQFQSKGIEDSAIPELIREAIMHGKVIGRQGNGPTPGDIYEVEFMKVKRTIMISISDNGFIVTAHPRSL